MRYVPEEETKSVLSFYHDQACGGHFGPKKTTKKFCSVDFISQIFSKMPMSFASVVIVVNIGSSQ